MSDKNDFLDVTTPMCFTVCVHDYISEKDYESKMQFDSYDKALDYIQNYDFISAFADHPIGICIRTSPRISFDSIDFTREYNGVYDE